jgi:hypothetical protein
MLSGCSEQESAVEQSAVQADEFEHQVAEYIEKFPYQETFKYVLAYTGGDPTRFNVWLQPPEPELVKAGEDLVVRTNSDTYYNMAFLLLDNGPVVLSSGAPSKDRFNSFQLMDDRNANYQNIIHPEGEYTLYFGDEPDVIRGKAIEVPSRLSVVLLRVEVKDKNDPEDIAAAKSVFKGMTLAGPKPSEHPQMDLLSGFSDAVATEANRRMDQTIGAVAFTETIVGPGQEPGRDVPFVNHAAGTKDGWGGPDPAHSSYEVIFVDENGDEFIGANGTYTVTTEEPPVNGFWSVTVYDTERGGFLHPNDDDRYHLNDTVSVRNDDGTVTFTFKQDCGESDLNCLEVPPGQFDIVTRYYLPHDEIISGEWTWPKISLQSTEGIS